MVVHTLAVVSERSSVTAALPGRGLHPVGHGDAVVLPGGTANPDALRTVSESAAFCGVRTPWLARG